MRAFAVTVGEDRLPERRKRKPTAQSLHQRERSGIRKRFTCGGFMYRLSCAADTFLRAREVARGRETVSLLPRPPPISRYVRSCRGEAALVERFCVAVFARVNIARLYIALLLFISRFLSFVPLPFFFYFLPLFCILGVSFEIATLATRGEYARDYRRAVNIRAR